MGCSIMRADRTHAICPARSFERWEERIVALPRLKLRAQDIERINARRRLALERAEAACRYLCSLGAKESFIFGSVLSAELFGERSDIDLAVSGLPREHIYKVEARIEEIVGGMPFDLVYLETAPQYLVERIREKGKRYACGLS
jgi:predicted nucleotidyltransferase